MEFKHTPAPWRWELNEKTKDINICGGKPMYDLIVMDFVRWGMNGAAPRFNKEIKPDMNLMYRAEEFGQVVKGREHHAGWFKNISHPDALLMVKAPEMIELLVECIDTFTCIDQSDEDLKSRIEQLIKEATCS